MELWLAIAVGLLVVAMALSVARELLFMKTAQTELRCQQTALEVQNVALMNEKLVQEINQKHMDMHNEEEEAE